MCAIAAERLSAKRVGELTFSLSKMEIINDLCKSSCRQQWWQDKERPGSEKTNLANKFVEDLCYETKQKKIGRGWRNL